MTVNTPTKPATILTLHLFVHDDTQHQRTPSSPVLDLIERMHQQEITCVVHSQAAQPPDDVAHQPSVFVSVGGSAADFVGLLGMPLERRRRWLHVTDAASLDHRAVIYCWLSATDPMPQPPRLQPTVLPSRPLVSVFTPAYRSGQRLQRPYQSLLAQTYPHWEWVVVDDSGDEAQTFRDCIGPLEDPRVVKVLLAQHLGRIGSVKRIAAGVCRGDILVELDHDDELTPDALERIVDALVAHPDCGFVFGDGAEVYEETGASHWYGWDAGFGYSLYWRQYDSVTGGTVDVQRTPDTNDRTIRHLVGLPNHPRAWTRSFYEAVGGHREGLSVADDFDLLLRSFVAGPFLRLPHLLYLQYRNAGGSNTTFTRNRQIQLLCSVIDQFYRHRVDHRMRELNVPKTAQLPYRRIWTCPDGDPRWIAADRHHVDASRTSRELFVLPWDDRHALQLLEQRLQAVQAAGWAGVELVVVGEVPQQRLEAAARQAPPGAVRWWQTDRTWPLSHVVRYGREMCSGAPSLIHGVDASITAEAGPDWRAPLPWVDRFQPIAARDRGFDRLHLLHWLQQRFGYSAYLEIGTDRDEVFSRMNGFRVKVGVDPSAGGTHRMTSDAFFAANRDQPLDRQQRFDLIFIDGLHEHQQVMRDVRNALACLLPGGTVVLHDCMPFEASQQVVPRPVPHALWTGDVWKAVFELRSQPDIDTATGRFDWGVSVIRVRPNQRPFHEVPAHCDWSFYEQHRDQGLNTMTFDDLLDWIDPGKP
jgi:glycosyltransferase involved in cell wall biosynthesis